MFYAPLIWEIQPSNDTKRQLGVFKVFYLVTGSFLAGTLRGASVC